MYANNVDLTEQKEQRASLGFNYRKALTLFFFSGNISYDHVDANNIASSIISNSFQERIVLPFRNIADAWTMSGSISKYSFALRTTFSGGILWQTNRSNQIQNKALLPYNTVLTNLNAGVETKLSGHLTFSYKANLKQTESHSDPVSAAPAYHIQELMQEAGLSYNPTDDLLFKLSGEHYITYQSQASGLKYFFADASAKCKIRKFKIDVELSAVNLFNVKNYSSLYLSANTFTASSFTLPGRIVMFKVLFNI